MPFDNNAYRRNVQDNTPKQETTNSTWVYGDAGMPSTRQIYQKISEMSDYDKAGAVKAAATFYKLQNTQNSPFYNAYGRATNQAVSNLASIGIDASGMNTDWFKKNTDWQKHLVYNGTTNTPSNPGKKATRDQYAAYQIYQLSKSAETTGKVDSEWAAMQQEIDYWIRRTDLNLSDDEIIAKIENEKQKKYPTLYALDRSREPGGTVMELNHGTTYSKDNMYGAIWAARNGQTSGDIFMDNIMSAGGKGMQWEPNADISARLDRGNPDTYSPYTVGMTADNVGMYFNVNVLNESALEKIRRDLDWNNSTDVSMYEQAVSVVNDTKKAKDEKRQLDRKIEEMVRTGWTAEDILKQFNNMLDGNDYPMLKKMDNSIRTGTDIVLTGEAVNFNRYDIEKFIRERCQQRSENAGTQGLYNNVNGDAIAAAQGTVENAGTTPDDGLYGASSGNDEINSYRAAIRKYVRIPGAQEEPAAEGTNVPQAEAVEFSPKEAQEETAEGTDVPQAASVPFSPAEAQEEQGGEGASAPQATRVPFSPEEAEEETAGGTNAPQATAAPFAPGTRDEQPEDMENAAPSRTYVPSVNRDEEIEDRMPEEMTLLSRPEEETLQRPEAQELAQEAPTEEKVIPLLTDEQLIAEKKFVRDMGKVAPTITSKGTQAEKDALATGDTDFYGTCVDNFRQNLEELGKNFTGSAKKKIVTDYYGRYDIVFDYEDHKYKADTWQERLDEINAPLEELLAKDPIDADEYANLVALSERTGDSNWDYYRTRLERGDRNLDQYQQEEYFRALRYVYSAVRPTDYTSDGDVIREDALRWWDYIQSGNVKDLNYRTEEDNQLIESLTHDKEILEDGIAEEREYLAAHEDEYRDAKKDVNYLRAIYTEAVAIADKSGKPIDDRLLTDIENLCAYSWYKNPVQYTSVNPYDASVGSGENTKETATAKAVADATDAEAMAQRVASMMNYLEDKGVVLSKEQKKNLEDNIASLHEKAMIASWSALDGNPDFEDGAKAGYEKAKASDSVIALMVAADSRQEFRELCEEAARNPDIDREKRNDLEDAYKVLWHKKYSDKSLSNNAFSYLDYSTLRPLAMSPTGQYKYAETMTPEEKNRFYYLLENDGIEEAEKYFKALLADDTGMVTLRGHNKETGELEEFAERNILTAGVATVASFASKIKTLPAELIYGNSTWRETTSALRTGSGNAVANIAGDNKGFGNFLKSIYNVGVAVVDYKLSAAIGEGLMGLAGEVFGGTAAAGFMSKIGGIVGKSGQELAKSMVEVLPMVAEDASGKYLEVYKQTRDRTKASEMAALEMLSGLVTHTIICQGLHTNYQANPKSVVEGFTELTERVITTSGVIGATTLATSEVEQIVEKAIMGADGEWAKAVEKYKAAGYSTTMAKQMADHDMQTTILKKTFDAIGNSALRTTLTYTAGAIKNSETAKRTMRKIDSAWKNVKNQAQKVSAKVRGTFTEATEADGNQLIRFGDISRVPGKVSEKLMNKVPDDAILNPVNGIDGTMMYERSTGKGHNVVAFMTTDNGNIVFIDDTGAKIPFLSIVTQNGTGATNFTDDELIMLSYAYQYGRAQYQAAEHPNNRADKAKPVQTEPDPEPVRPDPVQEAKDLSVVNAGYGTDATGAAISASAYLGGGDPNVSRAAGQALVSDLAKGDPRTMSMTLAEIVRNSVNPANTKPDIVAASLVNGEGKKALRVIFDKVANGRTVTRKDIQALSSGVAKDRQAPDFAEKLDASVRTNRIANMTNKKVTEKRDALATADAKVNDAQVIVDEAKTTLANTQKEVQAAANSVTTAVKGMLNDPANKENRGPVQQSLAHLNGKDDQMINQAEKTVTNAEKNLAKEQENRDRVGDDVMSEAREESTAETDQAIAAEKQVEAERQEQEAQAEAARIQQNAEALAARAEKEKQVREFLKNRGFTGDALEDNVRIVMNRFDAKNNGKVDTSEKLTEGDADEFLKTISRRTGITFQTEDLGDPLMNRGYIVDRNHVVLNSNLDKGQALVEAAQHEITHGLEMTGAYSKYADVALGIMYGGRGTEEYERALEKKQAEYGALDKPLSREDAEYELVAEFSRHNMANKKFIKQIVAQGIGEQYKQYVKASYDKIKGYKFKGPARTWVTNMKRAERLLQEAINERARMEKEGTTKQGDITNPEVQYSAGGGMTQEDVNALNEGYQLAVEDGDMEAAQDDVDSAAKSAMQNSAVRDEEGKLLKVYHGTNEQFTSFDMSKGRANMDIQGSFFSPWEIEAGGYGENVGAYYLNITNPAPEDVAYAALNRFKGQNEAGIKAREYLISLGYDGVANYDEYIAFYPEQIKSADPVTYDDNGNVIPLSERFNLDNLDIRYSSGGALSTSEIDTVLEGMNAEEMEGLLNELIPSISPISLSKSGDITEAQEVIAAVEDWKNEYDPTIYNGRLYVKPETIDFWLGEADFAPDPSNPEAAAAYITSMNPSDFLRMTTASPELQEKILGETTPLDEESLRAEAKRQPVELFIDEATGKITGHEGRHRSVALARAGVKEMPVLLVDRRTKDDKKFHEAMTLVGQDNRVRSEGKMLKNGNEVTLTDVIPLNEANKAEIIEKYTASDEERAAAAENEKRVLEYSQGGTLTDDEADKVLEESGLLPPEEPPTDVIVPEEPETDIIVPEELPSTDVLPETSGNQKQRQFGSKTAQRSNAVHDEVKDYLYKNSGYDPDTNAEQVDRAIEWIKGNASEGDEDGYIESLKQVLDPKFNFATADGQARMMAVAGMATIKAEQGDKRAIEDERAIWDAFNKQGTTIAQALQARNLFNMMSPIGKENALRSEEKRINDNLEKRNKNYRVHIPEDLLEEVKNAKTRKEFEEGRRKIRQALNEQIPVTWSERIIALRMWSMLSSPKTHIRNIVGNTMMIPTVGIKNKVGATIETVAQAAGKIDKSQRTKTLGLADKDAKAFAKDRSVEIEDVLRGGAKYKEGDKRQQERKVFGTKDNIVSKTLGKGFQWLMDKYPGEALEIEDWWFLKPHYERALSGLMTARGLKPEDMKGKVLEEAEEYALKEAWKATYRDESAVADRLNNLGAKGHYAENNKGLSVLQWIVNTRFPFKRTPINIAKRGIEYSPVGLGKSLTYDRIHLRQYNNAVKEGKAPPKSAISPTEWIDRFSAGLTGTGIMVAGVFASIYGLARAGLNNKDPEEQIAKMKGEQEYSIHPVKALDTMIEGIGKKFNPDFELELAGEDVSMTMDWAAPSVLPFFTGVALNEYYQKHGLDAGSIFDIVMEVTEPMMNMSFLSGVEDIFKNDSYSDKSGFWQFLEKTGINFATSFIPTWVGQISSTINGSKTTYNSPQSLTGDKELDRGIQQVGNKLGFLSLGGVPYTNTLGEEPKNVLPAWFENILSPAYFSRVDESEEMNELSRLYLADPSANKKIVPSSLGKTIKVNKEDIPLNGEQYTQLKKDRGEAWRETVKSLVDSPLYKGASDDSKAEMLNLADSYATQVAKYKFNGDYKMYAWAENAYKNSNAAEVIIDKVAESNKKYYIEGQSKSFAEALYTNNRDDIQKYAQELQEFHADVSTVRKQLTAYFKPLYKKAYDEKDEDSMENIRMILTDINSYITLDKKITKFSDKTFEGWVAGKSDEESETDERWLDIPNGSGREFPSGARFSASTGVSDSGKTNVPTRPSSDDDWRQYMDDFDEWWQDFDFEKNDPVGQFGKGTIDLNNRAVVKNDDGSISTEMSFSFYDEETGKEVLIPRIVNGKVLSENEAIDHYYKTVRKGKPEYLGMFNNWKDADEYATMLHNRNDWYYHR